MEFDVASPYLFEGLRVNERKAVMRVTNAIPAPSICRFCSGVVRLVSNATFYGGKAFGWPLAYACSDCGARVGCHPNTDIPLGTLADRKTMLARRAAHAAFDPLWQNRGPGARSRAYQALSQAMGRAAAHISWMDRSECEQVVAISRAMDGQRDLLSGEAGPG